MTLLESSPAGKNNEKQPGALALNKSRSETVDAKNF